MDLEQIAVAMNACAAAVLDADATEARVDMQSRDGECIVEWSLSVRRDPPRESYALPSIT
jgi:hypothetical protein